MFVCKKLKSMTEALQKKVDRAIKLIKSASGDDTVEVCYSGGKDSDVILELAKMSGIKYRALYKNTTIDPPGTIKHALEVGAEMVRPKRSFLKIIEMEGMPTRRSRHCCKYLKEYKILDKSIQGVRRSESGARSKRYSEDDPVICRIYGRNKKNHVSVILPILSWTDDDVKEFIEERGIKCHPLYYDDKGCFHVERRLDCMGCPLKSDAKSDFIARPKLFKAIARAAVKWWDTHPNTKSRDKFGTAYGMIAHNIFYNSYEDFRIADNNPLEGKKDWKKTLEQFFNVEL